MQNFFLFYCSVLQFLIIIVMKILMDFIQYHPFYNVQQNSIESISMSCHYSCATCSGNYYFDLCLTCPSTRTLLASICPCSSGYYQYQHNQCTSSSSAGGLDSALINVSAFAYYAAIGIHLLIIVLTINRILSIKLKKIIDTCQVVAMIYYYRYLQTDVATRGLKIMDAFNFNYLTNLICTKNGPPYGCNGFENVIGIGLSLILFFFLFLFSYLIATCIYTFQTNDNQVIYIKNGKQKRAGKDGNLGFMTYWDSLYSSLFLLYLDQTAIQTTMSICRIAIIDYYGVLLVIPFLILIVLVVRVHFKTINDEKQTTLAYRAKHSYFYYYDEYYHFNYIDHLFEDENLNKNKETLKKPFYPQSNLIILEILFKIFIAASTVVFYEYQPYLFIYCCIFLLIVSSCIMRVFFTYQLFELWFYYILISVTVFANAVFTVSSFFTYFISFTALGLILLAVVFIIITIAAWRKEKEGEMFKKIFENVKEKSNRVAQLEESEDEFMSHKQQLQVQVISNLEQSNIIQSFQPQNQVMPQRQISQRMTSHKQSIPQVSVMSKKKQSLSNMNESLMPNRRISRVTIDSIANQTNRLTVRNNKSVQQPMDPISESPKRQPTEKAQENPKNIFLQDESESLQ